MSPSSKKNVWINLIFSDWRNCLTSTSQKIKSKPSLSGPLQVCCIDIHENIWMFQFFSPILHFLTQNETFMPPLGLEALDFLALNHNLLTVLSASHFEGLPGLSSLELDYNKIAKIDTAAFKGLESKKSIWERGPTWYFYDLQVNCNSCRSLTTN